MNNSTYIIAYLFLFSFCHAQVIISSEQKEIENSAILEINSNLGFLPPIMTDNDRDLIPVDALSSGLLIYSLTSNKLNIYDGESWHIIKPQFKSVGTSKICPNDRSYRELLTCLQNNYHVENSLGYDKARDIIYGEIDLDENNQLEGIYTGYKITMDYSTSNDPSTEAFHKNVNAEHLFPQSMGAKEEPAKSDMFHIYPAKSNVNSSRNNCPHYEILDIDTDTWYSDNEAIKNIPSATRIDNYSEKDNDPYFPNLSSKQQCAFEPRESVKGIVARAVFYFYTLYNKTNVYDYKIYADDNFFEVMRESLINWNKNHPISRKEIERAKKINKYQGNMNPFLLDPELSERLYGTPSS